MSATFTNAAGGSNYMTTTQTYDGLNNLLTSTVTNQTGGSGSHTTTYTYGAGGRLATMTDAGGLVHTYQYDLDGHQMVDKYSRLNSAGTTINEAALTAYNALGQVTSQRKSTWTTVWTDGDVTNLQYNAWGEISAKGVNGLYQETFAYDYAGHLVRSTAGDGTVKFFLYDANGDQSATITTDGSNPSGRVWSTMSIDNALSDLTGSGIALGSTNVAGYAVTIATFDKRGQQLSTREPFRQLSVSSGTYTTATVVHSRTYNAFGEAASETDARGNVTNYTYNTVGKVTKRELPAVNYTNESGTAYTSVRPTDYTYYDASGRVVATMDANGNVNTRTLLAGTGYGGAEAMTVLEFHPDSGKFVNYYDGFGNMTKKSVNGIVNAISGSGEVDETFGYDAMDRLLTQTHPTRVAGSVGNVTGADQTLVDTYVYDGLGQRIKHYNSFLTGSVVETTDYDLQGRVTKTVDYVGYATTYGYVWTSGAWVKTTTQYNTSGTSLRSATETDDYFGRVTAKSDFGGHSYSFTFDVANRLVGQTTSAGESTTYTYYNTNRLASISATYSGSGYSYTDASSYQYDVDGNRTYEADTASGTHSIWYPTTSTTSFSVTTQAATITWDALNRMTHYADSGSASGRPVTVDWAYDLNGNVRHMAATYSSLNGTGGTASTSATEDDWYKYDSMNRFVVTKGVLESGVIWAGNSPAPGSGAATQGVRGEEIAYDLAGQRATATKYQMVHDPENFSGPLIQQITTEAYTYTADGFLAKSVEVVDYDGGTLRALFAYDAMGRVTAYTEYYGASITGYNRYNITYDNDSHVTHDVVVALQSDGSRITTTSDYYFTDTVDGKYDGGVVTRITTSATKVNSSGTTVTPPKPTDTVNLYTWWDAATQTQIDYDSDTTSGTNTVNHSYYKYDGVGHVQSVDIRDDRKRTVNFTTDANGMILERHETDDQPAHGDPHDLHYYVNGIQIGAVSNNGTNDVDYAASITLHNSTPGTWAFRNGSDTSVSYADFDQSYDPINGLTYQGTGSGYTVQSGDTLSSIAQSVWGDASMWYLLADANGLSGNATLAAGTVLSIPNKITNVHNSASTFKPYDPNDAMGNLSPTAPKPKHNSQCGLAGQILLAVIAIAVMLALHVPLTNLLAFGQFSLPAGATAVGATSAYAIAGTALAAGAGSVVSQGVGLATGIQKSFNWGAVAMSAIGSAVGGSLGAIDALSGVGIGMTALRAVAGNLITQGIGVATGLQKKFDWAGVAAAGVSAAVSTAVSDALPAMSSDLNFALSTGAGMLANAAARTLISGTDFGDNIMTALPDTFAAIAGDLASDALTGALAFRERPVEFAANGNGPLTLPSGSYQPSPGAELVVVVGDIIRESKQDTRNIIRNATATNIQLAHTVAPKGLPGSYRPQQQINVPAVLKPYEVHSRPLSPTLKPSALLPLDLTPMPSGDPMMLDLVLGGNSITPESIEALTDWGHGGAPAQKFNLFNYYDPSWGGFPNPGAQNLQIALIYAHHSDAIGTTQMTNFEFYPQAVGAIGTLATPASLAFRGLGVTGEALSLDARLGTIPRTTGFGRMSIGDFKAPALSVDSQGLLTNGAYRLDAPAMSIHQTGAAGGKSQFFYHLVSDSLTLDAAAYADKMNLWNGTKAKVILSEPIGVAGKSGNPTSVINLYRSKSGSRYLVHGSPGN